ncbi:hypothetical protein E5161_16815 [Cohnella pontilimi]|uniref:SLH domain-containing protein n=1 Tax=Cohnella pontilimi TaxID=2564100 RepID=A0A4U0F8E4_9BACL|nr:S-layer homology domain-containing protein [Cohnella pontilimi]TJY40800.1 hypothetical protein E5161_16815 [Cohnella pontilimi]
MIRNFAARTAIFTMIFSILALPNLNPASAAADETDSGLPVRTAQQIASLWKQTMNPKADFNKPYITAPSVASPYTPGSLRPEYVQDGVNALNFYRFISGLPADLSADGDLNLKAQYGAVLLASEGNFGHTPPQPKNMTDEFYQKGYEATSTSNIYASYGYNDHILFHSVQSYMDDSDTTNLDRVGHRRWILNPPLKKVGMGLAKGKDEFSYTALKIFDKSRTETVDYHYIAYPAQGPFPVEVFEADHAWSVSLNPKEYGKLSPDSVSVTVLRLSDRKTWKLGAANRNVTAKGAYFNVENSNYGTGPAVIFRPDGVGKYSAGDTYQVQIEGLKGIDGSSKRIAYTVRFMSAKADPQQPASKFTDTSRHWARSTIDWAAEAGFVSGYPDGTFKPENKVSEEEFLAMFSKANGAKVDTAGTSVWSDGYYNFALLHGFSLKGLIQAKSKSLPINRTSVAELLASAAGNPLKGNAAIQYILDKGYSKGKTAATVEGYKGSDNLTRAEAVQFIKNALDAKFTLPV